MKVRLSECGVSPSGRGGALFGEVLVGPLHRPRQNPLANVALVLAVSRGGREDEVICPTEAGPRLVDQELLAERREHIHVTDASVRLRVADPKPTPRQVDVAPAERECLPDPKSRERHGGEQRPAGDGAPIGAGLIVELARRLEERADLLGSVEPGPLRDSLLQAASLASRRVSDD